MRLGKWQVGVFMTCAVAAASGGVWAVRSRPIPLEPTCPAGEADITAVVPEQGTAAQLLRPGRASLSFMDRDGHLSSRQLSEAERAELLRRLSSPAGHPLPDVIQLCVGTSYGGAYEHTCWQTESASLVSRLLRVTELRARRAAQVALELRAAATGR